VIALLVVDEDPARVPPAPAALEILHAETAGAALERLSRNRRIDAVLFFDEALAAETAALLRREDPCAPPLFFAGPAGPAGLEPIDPGDPLGDLARRLGAA
jgi:hypothetical protein